MAAVSRPISLAPLLTAVLLLAGCWTAPVATVQPNGEARLIQGAIAVQSVKEAAIVSAVDRNAGTIVLRTSGKAETSNYKLGPKVSNLDAIAVGEVVQATVTEELTVYVLRDGQLPGAGALAVHARVLAVDPSYRLLKLQFPNGENETVKVPLGTRLEHMEAGDSVVIRPVEVIALRRKG